MLTILLTIQEPGKPRQRYVMLAHSTFAAIADIMSDGFDPHTYISAKPASLADMQEYPPAK